MSQKIQNPVNPALLTRREVGREKKALKYQRPSQPILFRVFSLLSLGKKIEQEMTPMIIIQFRTSS